MAYEDYRTKTTSRKIVLVEMDIGKSYSKWVNEGPGIWKTTLYFAKQMTYGFKDDGFCFSPFQSAGTDIVRNDDFSSMVDVGSVQEDGSGLTEYSTYADMYSNVGSWYFDAANQILYVHMTNDDWIYEHNMSIGVTFKLTNDSAASDLGNGYYEERLVGVPSISKTKDSHIYGLIQHSGGSFEALNLDGKLDHLNAMDYYGEQLLVKHGFQGLAYADFLTLTRTFIENAEFDWNTITFNLRDDRQRFSRKIPLNTFDQDTYSNLNDDDVGKAIPVFWGEIHNAEVICVNSEEGGTPSWTFKVCDVSDHSNGIQAIDHVYVDGSEVTPASTSLTNGTFTLNNGDWDGNKKVTFDGKGLKDSGGTYIEKLNIIEDLLSTYLAITYDSTNYDQTEWEAAEADDLVNDIGIWIDDPTEIIEIIEGICNSYAGNFIRKDNGKYTFRITDKTAASSRTLELQEYMESIRLSTDEPVTVVRIGYHKNIAENEYRWNVQDGLRSIIYAKYSKDKDIKIETYLVNDADAEELALHLYDLYDEAEPIVEIVTKAENIDLEIMDVITVPLSRVSGQQMRSDIVAELIGLNKEPLSGKVNITGRRLRDV